MTRPASIKSADLKRLAAIVKESGLRAEMEKNGVIVRLAPDIPTIHKPTPVEKKERASLI